MNYQGVFINNCSVPSYLPSLLNTVFTKRKSKPISCILIWDIHLRYHHLKYGDRKKIVTCWEKTLIRVPQIDGLLLTILYIEKVRTYSVKLG